MLLLEIGEPMKFVNFLFIFAFLVNVLPISAMKQDFKIVVYQEEETKNSAHAAKPQESSPDQKVLPNTCTWAIKKNPAQAYAVPLWCQSIAKILIPAKDNPADLYKGLEEIFIAVEQDDQRHHYVTPEFVARCIIELDIDITQLIHVKIPSGIAGGYSLLNKAIAEKHEEIIEALGLVLSDPTSFVPGVFYNGRRIGTPNPTF